MNQFHIGDRVECINEVAFATIHKGDTGTVVRIIDESDFPAIGVEWDRYLGARGHTCDGRCEDGYGYYIYHEIIKVIGAEYKEDDCVFDDISSLFGEILHKNV